MSGHGDSLMHYAVTIIGKDRTGIVAGTAGVLYRLGCNIEDSSCTILGGEFAMILIVSHEHPFSKARLLEGFKEFTEQMQLSVFVRTMAKEETCHGAPPGELCLISVYGSDQPGIVYRVASELAANGVTISDMNTRLIGSPEQPVYVMMLEAGLPQSVTVDTVQLLMEKLSTELTVEIGVRSITPVAL